MSATIALPSPVAAEPGSRTRLRLWPEWLTLFLYTAIVASAIPFHEPWADEAQAWQIAGHVSVLHLFTTNLRYEGHPALWYLLLKGLQHLGVTYPGMQWFAGLIATVSAAILIFGAPFPRIARLSLPFTFFLVYQYAVVARSYVLFPLLAFSVATVWKRQNALLPAALLGLLANVSLHAAAVSFGLAIVYHLECNRADQKPRHRTSAAIIFVLLLAIAFLTVLPGPKDIVDKTLMDRNPGALAALLWICQAIVFASRGLVSHPWDLGLLALTVLVWSVWRALPKRYLIPVAFIVASGGFFFSFWHLGSMTMTCTTIAWIAWPIRPLTEIRKAVAQFTVLILVALQLAYAAHALICDHYFPYSGDLAASQFLSPFVKAGTPMAVTYLSRPGGGAFFSVGLRPYLPGPLFLNETDPFWEWKRTMHLRVAFEAALKQHPPIVVVEYFGRDQLPFQLQRELYSRSISHLQEQGYVLTHTFCGRRPEDLRDREDVCHLIFEPAARAHSEAAGTVSPP
jgi:hypothetical protein